MYGRVMGLFDRFTRKPTAPPPPLAPLVALPVSAQIASFDVTDAVGTLALDASTPVSYTHLTLPTRDLV